MENNDSFTSHFWKDFTEAENIDAKHIKQTFRKIFTKWKFHPACLVRLCLVLYNKTCFFTTNTTRFSKKQMEEYAITYLNLWKEADRYALDTLPSKDIKYLYRVMK